MVIVEDAFINPICFEFDSDGSVVEGTVLTSDFVFVDEAEDVCIDVGGVVVVDMQLLDWPRA